MPKKAKITKEDILNCALKIVESEGSSSLSVRRIASQLSCSIQPIYYQFENFDALKKEVINRIFEIYHSMLLASKGKEKAYKEMGLQYIRFARMYPEYFKLLFMQKTSLNALDFIETDNTLDDILKEGIKLTNFSYEEQKKFHIKVWIFTHGLATLVATKTIKISEDEISKLLESTVRELLKGNTKGKSE